MDYVCVLLTKGMHSLIDLEDWEKVKDYKWRASDHTGSGGRPTKKFYAVTSINGKNVRLHRFILNYSGKLVVDHLNGNSLDNRKANLRKCHIKTNNRNRRCKSI